MRLWHKDLIGVLPRKQLLAQWRELCCIARNIAIKGTPNHILVNKIQDYPIEDFIRYSLLIKNEMERRGYRCDYNKFFGWIVATNYPQSDFVLSKDIDKVFKNWHNYRYLLQCYCNLEEKYDCGGISEDEWMLVKDKMSYLSTGGGSRHV